MASAKSEARKYLSNEIMILKNLNHPNIVKFQDLKKTKNHYFLIMECCNGGELADALDKYKQKNGTAFPEELVQHFMRQIIDAFKYLPGLCAFNSFALGSTAMMLSEFLLVFF